MVVDEGLYYKNRHQAPLARCACMFQKLHLTHIIYEKYRYQKLLQELDRMSCFSIFFKTRMANPSVLT